MKTPLIVAALLLAPLPALAQAAAGSVPNAFDRPAQSQQPAPARPAPAAPAAPSAQAPDVARAEEALRAVIASVQGAGFDYSVFTPTLAERIRQMAPEVTPLIKGWGAVRTVTPEQVEGDAYLFKIVFDNQVTEWMIVFDPEDKIAGLRFRPVEDGEPQ